MLSRSKKYILRSYIEPYIETYHHNIIYRTKRIHACPEAIIMIYYGLRWTLGIGTYINIIGI